MVTVRSQSWSWMIDPQPFLSMSISVPHPHSSNMTISNFDLYTTRSRSWVWSKGNTILLAQYLTDLLSFCFTSIRYQLLRYIYFEIWPWKSKVKVMGDVKGQGHIVHPVSNWRTSFSFHINRTNHSWDMSNRVFDLDMRNFLRKFVKNRVFTRIPLKSNQVITMTRGLWLLRFVVIDWVVLTFSCRQAYFCLSMSQPWPWVKVTQRSSSTFLQTYTFFVPNI